MRPIHEHEINHKRAARFKVWGPFRRPIFAVFTLVGPSVAGLISLTEQSARTTHPELLVVVGLGYWFGLATFVVLGRAP